MKPFFVYLLRCSDGSYYVGQTDNIEVRMQQHHAGEYGYTATRKPVELVWQGEFETREAAIAFEQQIKGWARVKKEALIAGDWERVKELAKSKKSAQSNSIPQSSGPSSSAHLELAEGTNGKGLRQAQPEREGTQFQGQVAQQDGRGA
jgi:predicted GIY-YIG superfamily endonuclease